MDHNEWEEPREDLVVEVTNLDQVDDEERSPGALRVFMRSWLLSSRYRKHRTGAIILFVGLALLMVFCTIVPLGRLFLPGGPTTRSSTYDFGLDANPPWGDLSADGKRVALFARGAYTLFSLSRGQHTLTWHAAPFAPQQCRLSVPVDFGSDTCVFSRDAPDLGVPIEAYIHFPSDLSVLSVAQRTALLQSAQTVLDRQQSSELVQAGEIYAQTSETAESRTQSCHLVQMQRAAVCFVTAHQPLEATLRLQLDGGPSPAEPCAAVVCDSGKQDCRVVCDLPAYLGFNRTLPPTVWQASVLVHLLWQFATRDGRIVEKDQADSFVLGQQNALSMLLNITWNGKQWGVTPTSQDGSPESDTPVCSAAFGDMSTLVFASTPLYVEPQLVPGPTPASGCLITIPPSSGFNGEPTPTPASPTVASVIQRFGVLLAANATAHLLWPFLPVADTFAQHIAQQWRLPGD